MAVPLRLLIIEDLDNDAQLIVQEIKRGGFEVEFERVDTASGMQAALDRQTWDLILCDYKLPAFEAPRALELLKARGIDLPFITLSGSFDEKTAVAALKAGAHDFMIKNDLTRLVPAIQRELQDAGMRRERKQVMDALRESEERFRLIVEGVQNAIVVVDASGKITLVNPQTVEIFGYSKEELLGQPVEMLVPNQFQIQHINDRKNYMADPTNRLMHSRGALFGLHKDGHEIPVEIGLSPFQTSKGLFILALILDITDRKKAEEALRESEQCYRSLFEDSPISIWEEDFSLVKQRIDDLRRQGITDLRGYFESHPDVVRECASLINVVNVNSVSLNLFGAESRDDLLSSLGKTLTFEGYGSFQNELVNIAEGKTDFQWEGVNRTLAGDYIYISLHWSVIPGYKDTLSRVMVSIVDITERKQRERELEAIAKISAALRETQTVKEILPRLLDEALSLLGTDSGSIWLYDPGSAELSMTIHRGWEDEPLSRYPRGQNIPDLVVARREAIIAREFRNDPRVPEDHRKRIPEGVGGACVPLLASNTTIGALFVNVQLPREITPGELRVLNALAEIGGNAIHRANLLDQTVKQLDRMAALRSIDIAISSSFDLKMTLNVVLEKVTRELNVDAADILLLKPESTILEYAAGLGFWSRTIEATTISVGEGLAGKAALERKIIYYGDLSVNTRLVKRGQLVTEEKFISYYGVPLVSKGKVKGVLEIFSRAAITRDEEWQQFLDAVAGQTAIAIDSSSLFQDLQRTNLELALAYDATIEGWSRALDLRDKETEGHTLRVTETTLKLAQVMGINDEELIHIRRGSLLHDIGKMGVPDRILLKPDKLTKDEWANMHKHPEFAYKMLMPISYLRPALDIPYCHHEKWDGTGYPRGLKGDQIPLAARIFSVVDVWDALRSDRPYRAGWKMEDILKYIKDQSGKHFDPRVVDVFLNQIVNT